MSLKNNLHLTTTFDEVWDDLVHEMKETGILPKDITQETLDNYLQIFVGGMIHCRSIGRRLMEVCLDSSTPTIQGVEALNRIINEAKERVMTMQPPPAPVPPPEASKIVLPPFV